MLFITVILFFCRKHLFKCKDTQQKCTINAHLLIIYYIWRIIFFFENCCCTHLRFKLTAHTAKTAKKPPTITNKITTIVTVVNLSALIVLSAKVEFFIVIIILNYEKRLRQSLKFNYHCHKYFFEIFFKLNF